MSFEIIAKASGGGYTLQWEIGPYKADPPTSLLQAITSAAGAKFEEWTGAKLETCVVTSMPTRSAGVGSTG